MRGIKFTGTTILLVLLLASLAFAADFDVNLVTVEENILPGDSALFDLTIKNTYEEPDKYQISSQEFSWILFIDPAPAEIDPGSSQTYEVQMQPRSFVNYGTHRVALRIKSLETGEIVDLDPIVFIRNPEQTPGVYTPSIALQVGTPEKVDPREDMTLNVHLRNRNARTYNQEDPIQVVIQSDLFYKEYLTNLGPLGQDAEKTSEIRLQLDPFEKPGKHELSVKVSVEGEVVSTQTKEFEIVTFTNIEETKFEETNLFKTTTLHKLRNDGNVQETGRIVYPISAIQRPFVTSSHNYEVKDVNGQLAVVVEQDLTPQEEVEVSVTENYRLLAILIILVVLSIIGYYLLRSPIVLAKEANITGKGGDDKSELKVQLLVKNRSSKTMRNLRVIDKISGAVDIQKEDSLGTLKPNKIVKKPGQGTLLRWDLDQLDPFEERIISYKALTPLKLVGDITLPNMKVKYDLPSGRERTSHSNEVTISRRE